MDRIAVETTSVLVLADGKTPTDISNNRGHLLETFVAQVLATLGYTKPRTEHLNVVSDGIELDVVATHLVTGDKMICECKAYSTNIAASQLTSFIGKFALARADKSATHGLFVGLPRLTNAGREQAEKAEATLDGFRVLGAYELLELLEDAKLMPDPNKGPVLKSDLTLVITEHGLALAARDLDPDTRRATRWVIWGVAGKPPQPLIDLFERDAAAGLPVVSDVDSASVPLRVPTPPIIIDVQGSSSDFEYQLPAAPQFFVGRQTVSDSLSALMLARTKAGSIVINAKSGWGKSSLALRLKQSVDRAGGIALVVDARTAERPEFVIAALEKLVRRAAESKAVSIQDGSAFTSLRSILTSLSDATWSTPKKPLFLAFDQFENVFRYEDLTKEFRDLALLIRESDIPLTVAFCWKTDLVGWTESHPYRLRDEIRDASHVEVLNPLGPREIETLLRRLEKSLNEKLHRELRQRLREYSQGLPWLFKKLAGHVLTEVQRGVSQEELTRQALNVQSLFETDLSVLNPAEQSVLRTIAQAAPVSVSEINPDAAPNAVLESLLHQRLIVQVGDTLDIYWDTFRDFLNTGRVSVEDSYVVRYAPLGAGRLLRAVLSAGGSISVASAASALATSSTVIFNYARELRLFGVLVAEPNNLSIEPALMADNNREEAIRLQVAQALRRHKMYKVALDLLGQQDRVLLSTFAAQLPDQFPTVEAKPDSWFTYARSFAQWMDYAGLVELRRDGFERIGESSPSSSTRLLSGAAPIRVRSAFPGASAGPAIQLLLHLSAPHSNPRPAEASMKAAVRDLSLLQLIDADAAGLIALSNPAVVREGLVDTLVLRTAVETQRGMKAAFDRLEADPSLAPMALGQALRDELRADWGEATTFAAGKFIRGWARACGIKTKARPARQATGDAPAPGVGAGFEETFD